MSDTVSFAELDGQHVELLPARTVLSMFSAAEDGGLTDLFTKVTQVILPGESTGGDSTAGAAGESK